MRVHDNGTLGHLHFGAALDPDRSHAHLGPTGFAGFKNRIGDPVPLEYPTTGTGDYRIPALTVELADGSTVLDLVYREHRILPGKPARPADDGLPARTSSPTPRPTRSRSTSPTPRAACASSSATRSSATTPVIARSARIHNDGTEPVRLTGAMSAALDLPDARWEFVQLSGAWARENHVVTRRLRPGRQSVGSDRGASSHQHNPFLALRRAPRPRTPARPTASASSTRATSSPRPRSTRSTRPGSGSGSARTRSPGPSSRARRSRRPRRSWSTRTPGSGR